VAVAAAARGATETLLAVTSEVLVGLRPGLHRLAQMEVTHE
jgi:hypothetical protein